MRRSFPLATLALLASLPALGAGPAAAQDEPEPARMAPLAPQALLLDLWEGPRGTIAVGERGILLLDTGEGPAQRPGPVSSMLCGVTGDGTRAWAVGHDAVVLASEDGGESWELRYRDVDRRSPLFDVMFRPDGTLFASGAYGLLLRSDDGGDSFEELFVDEEEPHLYQLAARGDSTLYLAGEFGKIFRSDDHGESWRPLPSPYGGSWFGLALPADGALLVYGLRGNCWRSEDDGLSWAQVETGTEAALLADATGADGTLWLSGLSGTLLRSDDGGRSFVAVPRGDRLGLAAILPTPRGLRLAGEGGLHEPGGGAR